MAGRGAGWVVAQFLLIAVLLVAGFLPPDWPDTIGAARTVTGALLAVAGLAIAVWAGRSLGGSLTPFPKPVGAGLVTSGPFGTVRHPIYSGGLLFFVGYALLTGVLALVLTGALAALWAGKVQVEERLLANVYPEYAAYRRHVRWRLCPRLY